MALPRNFRLPRRSFIQTKLNGHTYSSHLFSSVIFSESKDVLIPKCSVVIGLKMSKSAVVRNHLKRQIYKSFLDCINKPLAMIIVYPKKSVLNLTDEKLRAEFDSFLSKIPT